MSFGVKDWGWWAALLHGAVHIVIVLWVILEGSVFFLWERIVGVEEKREEMDFVLGIYFCG